MKRISLLAVSFIVAAVFASSAFAQTGAQPGAGKIGWLDTGSFGDEKEGVTKYLNALKGLEAVMKPLSTELNTIGVKLNTINEDIKKMTANPAIPIDQKALAAKQEEGQRLQREGEFKKKEYDAQLEKRSGEILGPVTNDILKAVQDYAKQKGFAVVLDIAALANQNLNAILALDPSANITKDFITYYNARQAPTAAATVPK
jgi:Skp family chaperone for outer membrane proteins